MRRRVRRERRYVFRDSAGFEEKEIASSRPARLWHVATEFSTPKKGPFARDREVARRTHIKTLGLSEEEKKRGKVREKETERRETEKKRGTKIQRRRKKGTKKEKQKKREKAKRKQ